MSFFIIQHNVYKLVEMQQKAQIFLNLDTFLQSLTNILITSVSQSSRSYYMIIQTKNMENVQVLFQSQMMEKYLKMQFKPTKLTKLNFELILRSERSVIQLNTKLQTVFKSSKSLPYKYYLNKNGILTIEITYLAEQLVNFVHAQYIMNKTIIQVSTMIDQILLNMVPYMRLQSVFSRIVTNQNNDEDSESQKEQLTFHDRIKYMTLLNQVYKSHRHQSHQEKNTKQSQLINPNLTIEGFCKANNLVQQDTKFVQKISKENQQCQQKLREIFKLVQPKLTTKKQHLNMYKMYLTQKQFQKYVKSAKKQHLQIYQITSMQYRIVKGVQNKILLNSQKLLTQNGSHSSIYFGTYSLHLSDTLFHYQTNVKEEDTEQKVVVKPLVVKRIKKDELQSSVNSFKNQLCFLYHCKDKRSKFIATYFLPLDKFKDDLKEIYIQYYQKNLLEFIQNRNKSVEIDLLHILKIAENIIFALIFMVENSALHRDLKPSNVMIDSSMKARMIDFGSCCPIYNRNQFSVKEKRILTTPQYQVRYKQCPQEVRKKYQRQQYEQHLLYDIYSLGVTLKQVLDCGKYWEQVGQKQGIKIGEIIEMIIGKCKQPDPIDRVTFDELLYYIYILKGILKK